MPKVVTFSLFFPLSISSCAVWASALLQQKQKRAASIFFIAFLLGENGRPVRALSLLLLRASLAGWGWVLRDYLETVDAQAMFAPRGPPFKGSMDKIAQLADTPIRPLQDATARGHRSPSRARARHGVANPGF
jgi:hypothetical protein